MTYQNPTIPALTESDQRLWATLVHVGSLFFGFLAPLVGFLVFKDRGVFLRHHTAESLNFQLTGLLATIVVGILGVLTFGIGFALMPVVGILLLIFPILAAVAANRGEMYHYPLAIKFVR